MSFESESKGLILVVEDDDIQRLFLAEYLESLGYEVNAARDGSDARALVGRLKFDLALLDVRLPDVNGLELTRELKTKHPGLAVIVCTGYSADYDFLGAVEAGASDWVAKPFKLKELLAKVERVRREQERTRELAKKNRELEKTKVEMEHVVVGMKEQIRGGEGFVLPERVQRREDFPEIIGHSEEIEKLLKLVRLVANTNSSVLLTGESGTGKELIAKAIYARSPRANGPFVLVNCGSLPETLLESELFGHERGAFTGAVATKRGLIEEAHRGTLFLDEVGETTPAFQVKLLRVLQYGEFKRVGSVRSETADIRVIGATNAPLEKMVRDGTFREDLYYRLNQFPIPLPPLRDRMEDLPLLSQYFLEKSCLEYSRPLVGFSSEVMEKMFDYAWPGNIRELENMVAQAVILATPPLVELKDMPTLVEKLQKHPRKSRPWELTYANAKEEFERRYFRSILDQAKGNISAASRLCKLERKHFREKVRKLGLLSASETRRGTTATAR